MKLLSIAASIALLATPILAVKQNKAIEVGPNNDQNVRYVTVVPPPVTKYIDNPDPVTLTVAAMEVVTQTYTPIPTETVQPTSAETIVPETTTAVTTLTSSTASSSSSSTRSSASKICTTLNLPIETTIDGQSTSFMSEVSTCVNPGTQFEVDDEDDESSSALPLIMGVFAFLPAIIVAML